MFATTNNTIFGSLKGPSAMVFLRKRTVCASASHFLLPFVSSLVLWMTRCTVALVLWPCVTVPSGHPQHLGCDSFNCCTERYEIFVYCCFPSQVTPLTYIWHLNCKHSAELGNKQLFHTSKSSPQGPLVLRMTQCNVALGIWPLATVHWVIHSTCPRG